MKTAAEWLELYRSRPYSYPRLQGEIAKVLWLVGQVQQEAYQAGQLNMKERAYRCLVVQSGKWDNSEGNPYYAIEELEIKELEAKE